MNFSKFNLTPSAKSAISKSQKLAEELGHLKVIDIHLIICVLRQDNANIHNAFEKNEYNIHGIIQALEAALDSYKEPKRKKKIFAPEIFEILDIAKELAQHGGCEYIGSDHIALAILESREEIIEFLGQLGVELPLICESLSSNIFEGVQEDSSQKVPISPGVAGANPSEDFNLVQECCENLNKKVEERGSFEIFGRDEEINRAFEVLLKKNKSNIIFVGEAGCGKTAVVEGMAEKIVKRECPDLLLNREILALDVTSVLSGTMYRGQMEEKIKKILNVIKQNPRYIVFIDEIHTIVGSGGPDGGLDIANILKPALSRGEISCIGATTEDEYKSFFKKDSALDRRFENIAISEPSVKQAKELISKAKVSYEEFHQVSYSNEVIELIIDLCSEYLPDRKFPDKAFDILDESGARVKKEKIKRPQEAKDIEVKLADMTEEINDFNKLRKEYEEILQKWGDSLKNKKFNVDKDVIYDLFANKLNVSIQALEKKEKLTIKGRIGF